MKFVQWVKEISVHNGNIHVHQAPFFRWHGIKQKEKEKKCKLLQRNTCMKLNCSINFHLGFYKCQSGQTDSEDQDQTAQTVQSDVGFTLSVNLWNTFLSKYDFEMALFRF